MAARLTGPDEDAEEVHEINVTPFIDVMLVLLIIFMVAAPLSTVDVHVDLPSVSAKPQQRPDKPLFLTIKADGTLSLGEQEIARERLVPALTRATNADTSARIFLRADKSVRYGDVIAIMEQMRAAGFTKVALVALEGATPP